MLHPTPKPPARRGVVERCDDVRLLLARRAWDAALTALADGQTRAADRLVRLGLNAATRSAR